MTDTQAPDEIAKKGAFFSTPVPTQWVGPISIHSQENGSYTTYAPLATYESPLWPSVQRGLALAKRSNGISTVILRDTMSRSIVVDTKSAQIAFSIQKKIENNITSYIETCEKTSQYLKIHNFYFHISSTLLYIRISGSTGDASGHNMITKAADALIHRICSEYKEVRYISISGNLCTDKKVSAVNSLLGRGKSVIAEVTISEKHCLAYLRAKPEEIVELNIKKNMMGSILAGSLASANAHFANMLLALYLATGQDAANIVEGSQGVTYCEIRDNDLYFSVTLPNIIVGTVGNGKDSPYIISLFEKMGCLPKAFSIPGQASRKLAEIIGAVVLAGELSLLGAQTNQGELVSTHMTLERSNKKSDKESIF